MKKFFSNLFIILYAIVAIFLTVCLLSYNDQKVTEFGNYSLIIIDSNEIKGDFDKGSLVIVDGDIEPEIGEKAFFYNTSRKNEISLAEVKNKEHVYELESTYYFDGDKAVSSSNIIGSTENVTVIPKLGTIMGILESKWGFLFIIVLPILLAFLYEVAKLFDELRNSKYEEDDGDDNEEDSKKVKVVKEEPKQQIEEKEKEDLAKEKLEKEKLEKLSKEIDEIDNLEDIEDEVEDKTSNK